MTESPVCPPAHGLLNGKRALLTAAAGAGIGFSAAERFLAEGCEAVVISDIHERRLGEAVERLRASSPQAEVHGVLCDVSQQAQVDHLVREAHAFLGRIDVLVNNAGLGGEKRVVEMSDEDWNRVLDISLTGTFRMTRAVLPIMQAQGAGAIVNNASVLGWRAQKAQAHYAAAKAGVMAFTRCVALEAAEFGVRVNAVSPSIALHPFLKKSADPALLVKLSEQEAFGRAAEPWEIANVMVFLASDYASYLVGESLSVSSQRA
ncbi:MAG: hypothetical protein RL133_655 [Pseudomonadota bacterium]|jgi:3-oxoacyl-[acyl-carrier protein] reductase